MPSASLDPQLTGVPVAELATWMPPSRWHAALCSSGTHRQGEEWIVAGQAEVPAALGAATMHVAPPPGAPGPAADLLAQMARFSNGADHRRRRETVVRLLPAVAGLATAVTASTSRYLQQRAADFDVMPMARSLPAGALAIAMGLTQREASQAASLTGRLSDGVTPTLAPRPGGRGDADEAAARLLCLLAAAKLPGDGSTGDTAVAAASILFQAREATAGLIGLAVAAANESKAMTPRDRVEQVLRHDAPTQNTRRTAAAATVIGDEVVPAGAPVWIFVATAERGAAVPATFGSGPHGCPAAAHAALIASQVVTLLEQAGWQPVAGQQIDFEPRPNVRIPRRLMVSRAGARA